MLLASQMKLSPSGSYFHETVSITFSICSYCFIDLLFLLDDTLTLALRLDELGTTDGYHPPRAEHRDKDDERFSHWVPLTVWWDGRLGGNHGRILGILGYCLGEIWKTCGDGTRGWKDLFYLMSGTIMGGVSLGLSNRDGFLRTLSGPVRECSSGSLYVLWPVCLQSVFAVVFLRPCRLLLVLIRSPLFHKNL